MHRLGTIALVNNIIVIRDIKQPFRRITNQTLSLSPSDLHLSLGAILSSASLSLPTSSRYCLWFITTISALWSVQLCTLSLFFSLLLARSLSLGQSLIDNLTSNSLPSPLLLSFWLAQQLTIAATDHWMITTKRTNPTHDVPKHFSLPRSTH